MSGVTSQDTVHSSAASDGDVHPDIVQSLLSIAKSTRALFGLRLAELGLSNGQDEMLLALDEVEPISVTALAEKLSVRPSTVSKALDRLVSRGMAQRYYYETDARQTLVRITPEGVDVRKRVTEMRENLEAELNAALAADDGRTAVALRITSACLQAKLRRLR